MRVVAIIQARMGSNRLPGKSLLALAKRPLIAHVIERTRAIPGVDDVVLATTEQPRDDALVATAVSYGVPAVRGDEHDVLGRVLAAAHLARAEAILRVTGDCPLLCPRVAAVAVATYRAAAGPAVYVWNDTARSGWPDGTDVEVFAYDALVVAHAVADLPADREHVTPWLRRNGRVVTMDRPAQDWSHVKLSVDRAEDYDRVRQIYAHLAPGALTLAATLAAADRAGVL